MNFCVKSNSTYSSYSSLQGQAMLYCDLTQVMVAWSMWQPTQMALFPSPSVLCTLSRSWVRADSLLDQAAASCLETVEGAYGGTACSVPEQAAFVSGLSICSFRHHEKQTTKQESRARIALIPFIESPFPPRAKITPSKQHSPCLSLSSLFTQLEGGGCRGGGRRG